MLKVEIKVFSSVLHSKCFDVIIFCDYVKFSIFFNSNISNILNGLRCKSELINPEFIFGAATPSGAELVIRNVLAQSNSEEA